MFPSFRSLKLLLDNKSAAHHIIHRNYSFLKPISEKPNYYYYYFSTLIDSKDNPSYTVSYLINSCGFSPESAKSASEKVNFKKPQRPDSVIDLLNKYGFSKTQIFDIVRSYPVLLSYDPEKTLLPKLFFFKSIGVSDVTKLLSSDPFLFLISLENRMVPAYKFLKSILGCDKKIVTIYERSSWVLYSKNIIPNIILLRENTVPSSSIELLLNHYPLSIIRNHEVFRVAFNKVKEMGFNPLKSTFVLAVRVLSGKSSELIWDRCSKKYKKWGWSEDDILSAFKKHPSCMVVSEEKIDRTMGFLVDKFGCESKTLANFPCVFNYNVEKRIIPRCLVLQLLSSKGLIKEMSLRTILLPSDKLFLDRFVTRYEDQLPHLMKVYRGEADVLAF